MNKIDIKALDKIVKETVAAIEENKAQIYDVYEAAKSEMDNISRDVERIRQEMEDSTFKADDLEIRDKQARTKLMQVSRHFSKYKESDIKEAYENASTIQIELAVAQNHEKDLQQRLEAIEVRLGSLKKTVVKAEGLVSQIGVVLGFLGNQMNSVTEHIESMQQRQMFGMRVIKAQEDERQRVSREIHDEPAQVMANVIFRAEMCEKLIDKDIEGAKGELRALREQVRLCLTETRKIIFDLRPMALDDLGLVPTVRRVVEAMKERSDTHYEIKILGEVKRLSAHIELGVFRVIQEALKNIEKHAGAKVVSIRIEFRPQFISAFIEDDGGGFDSKPGAGAENLGLMGMRERMELLDGDITIKSEKGKGTKVFIKSPVHSGDRLQVIAGGKMVQK